MNWLVTRWSPQLVAACLLAGCSLFVAGCTADCSRACSHLVKDCGVDRPDYSEEDCTTQCERFLAHYDPKRQRRNARDAVRCVRSASCDELASGTPCYDDAVYPW